MSTDLSAHAEVYILDLHSSLCTVLARRPAPRNERFSNHNCDAVSALSQSQLAFDNGLFVLLFQFRHVTKRHQRSSALMKASPIFSQIFPGAFCICWAKGWQQQILGPCTRHSFRRKNCSGFRKKQPLYFKILTLPKCLLLTPFGDQVCRFSVWPRTAVLGFSVGLC